LIAPNGFSKHIRHSPEKVEKAIQSAMEFNASLTPTPLSGPVSLGVILIQFSDFSTNDDAKGGGSGKYIAADYDNLFFSTGYYNTPKNFVKSPDLDEVFGSFNDYWREVSYNQAWVVGDILNPKNGDKYGWVMADHDRSYYNGLDSHSTVLPYEAMAKAKANPNFKNPDNYDVLCILYAGEWQAGGLQPFASAGGSWYLMSEMRSNKFIHIGPHCHEFAHAAFSLPEKYRHQDGYGGDAGQYRSVV
jgi:M6 family metalloprotease-like protein